MKDGEKHIDEKLKSNGLCQPISLPFVCHLGKKVYVYHQEPMIIPMPTLELALENA